MSEAEHPDLAQPERKVTVEDVRALMGASTPHFALQIRNRIAALIKDVPEGDPARIDGEREIKRLEFLADAGEFRGEDAQDGQRPLPSASLAAQVPSDDEPAHG